jgi:hypothetical protein
VRDGQYLLCNIDTVKAVRESIRGPKSGPIIEYVFGQPILSFITMQVIRKTRLILSHHTHPGISAQGERQHGGADEQEDRQTVSGERRTKVLSATIAVALFRPKI